jgi:type I restriction enzyme M protein
MQESGDFLNRLWSELDRQRSSSFRRLYRGQMAGLIAALLFLRWLDLEESEREAVSAFDESNFEPTLPSRLRWTKWTRLRGPDLHRFVTDELPHGLRSIDGSPHRIRLQRIADVFELDLGKQTFLFDMILDWINELDLASPAGLDSASRILDDIVQWAVDDQKSSGEHITPQGVVDLMVELADPQPGNRIYDPCFGSAGLLVACARRLREKAKRLPLSAWNDLRTNSFFGVEINPVWYVIGMTRLVLAGIPEPGLELGDALERSTRKTSSSEKFDVVLACPPWGWWGKAGPLADRQSIDFRYDFRIKSKDAENLFVQHVAESLRPGGKAVVAVPEGTLFKPGADKQLRQWLLQEFRVDGVISLPAGAFSPFTNIKSNLLVFRREQPASKVRFCVVHSLAGAERRPSSETELPIDVARRFTSTDGTELFHERLGKCRLLRVEGTDWIVEVESNGIRHRTPPEKRSEFKVVRDGSLLTQDEDTWDTPIKDLALREWELVAKASGVDQLQQLLDTLSETDDSIPVQSLSSIAEVFAGTSYDKRTTIEKPDDLALAGLIRVADVQEGKIGQPALFLTNAAEEKLSDRLRLQKGDILASTSGSIGKIAVVPATATPLVASKSVVVIRPQEGILPGYLAALLQSESYQGWLAGHARGSTIQHLSVRTLRHLQVPVPSIQLQERVATICEGRRGDALTVLVELITGNLRDPIVEWLDSSEAVKAILDQKGVGKSSQPTMLLERLAESCKEIRNRVVHGVDGSPDSKFTAWITTFSEAMEGLRGISRVPDGSAQLSILEGTRAGIARSTKILGDRSLPAVKTAISLARQVEDSVAELRERLLDTVEVQAKIEPEVIEAGRSSEVILRVRNESPLPLRGVVVSTEPPVGKSSVNFLGERQEVSIPLTIPAPDKAGFYDFQAKWNGTKLDGRTASGRIPLRIEVRGETRTAALPAADDLGTSPYIVGQIIDRPDMLFGREEIIDRIKRQFSNSQRANVILLEGNRRTGKSSILKRLGQPGELPGWIAVSIDFQGGASSESKAGLPTNEVFRLIARQIGWQLYDAGITTWFPGIPSPSPQVPFKVAFLNALDTLFVNDRPAEILELYLQDVLQRCKPRKLVLFLDEFDKIQEGIEKGLTSPQVPSNIRYLILRYPELSAVFAGSPRLKRMRQEYWSALFGLGLHIPVSKLSLEAARLLVTRPVAGRLAYVDEARDLLVALCARYPFIIQSLCERVFEDAIQTNTRTVTVSMVETAAQKMSQDFEHFRTLWDYAATSRRRLIIALVERLAHDSDPVTYSLLEVKLEEAGVVIPNGERLGDDIDFLREIEILDLDTGGAVSVYALAIPLMGRWIHNNIDFDDLRQKAIKEGQETLA